MGNKGAALFEYALVFSLFCTILYAIVAMGWWWWNQTTAAVAIHDGVRDTVASSGNIALGYRTTREILRKHLGRVNADWYEGHFSLQADPVRRSVQGGIYLPRDVSIPFVGDFTLSVRARSFQRQWRFYGGPPDFWE